MPQGHTCVKLVGPTEDWSLEWCWHMGQMSWRGPDVLEGFRTTTPAKINTLPLPQLAVGMWTLDLHLHWTEQDTVFKKLFELHQTWGLDRRNPGYKEKVCIYSKALQLQVSLCCPNSCHILSGLLMISIQLGHLSCSPICSPIPFPFYNIFTHF